MILRSRSYSCVSWTVPVTRGCPSFAPGAAGLLAKGSPGRLEGPLDGLFLGCKLSVFTPLLLVSPFPKEWTLYLSLRAPRASGSIPVVERLEIYVAA